MTARLAPCAHLVIQPYWCCKHVTMLGARLRCVQCLVRTKLHWRVCKPSRLINHRPCYALALKTGSAIPARAVGASATAVRDKTAPLPSQVQQSAVQKPKPAALTFQQAVAALEQYWAHQSGLHCAILLPHNTEVCLCPLVPQCMVVGAARPHNIGVDMCMDSYAYSASSLTVSGQLLH